ncbi:hypothetical protein [Carboxylicivirga taeanensis]|uniref:hypothetical protein n=1 Tax=Carboxylicivirga taeanensis TaxID=1416875 RepID=UPI003F6DA668
MNIFEFNKNEIIKIELNDFKKRFDHELRYLEEYFELNKKMLIKRKWELDSCLSDDILNNPELEDTFRDFYLLDYIKIPCYFYNSAIVSLYSLLENNLNSLCEIIQTETNFVIGLNDLTGSNIIDKGRRFLIKIANIDFRKVDKEWIRITDYQKLRNLIVHNNSQIKNRETDFKLLSRFNGIKTYSVEKDFHISDIKVISDFLALIKKFISSLIDQIEERKFKKFITAQVPYPFDEDEKIELPF